MTIRFSAVIPTHNRPELVRRAVNSVRAQTLPPIEIIVVDDGSTPPLIEQLTGLPETLCIVRNDEPTGPAAARNLGVRHASGDFIAFLDDDDEWVPWKLERIQRCLAEDPTIDVVLHKTVRRAPSGKEDSPCVQVAEPLKRMLYMQPPHLDGVIVRRALHLREPLDDNWAGASDLDYMLRLAKSGGEMVELNEALAVLGDNTESAIATQKRIEGRLRLLERHPEIAADRRALAFFNLRLGHQYRRSRKRPQALYAFARSLISRPSSSAMKGIVATLLPDSAVKQLLRRQ